MTIEQISSLNKIKNKLFKFRNDDIEIFRSFFQKGLPAAYLPQDFAQEAQSLGLIKKAADGWISELMITEFKNLLIFTDFPKYKGTDRVLYLLEDESLLLARQIPDCKGKSVLDIGTGSGIQALTAAKMGASNVQAIDISGRALAMARLNSEINEIQNIQFFNLPIGQYSNAPIDIVLFNPPFIPVPKEGAYPVSGSAGYDGLQVFREILTSLPEFSDGQSSFYGIMLSPGDSVSSEIEKLLVSKLKSFSYNFTIQDIYHAPLPIEDFVNVFNGEPNIQEWKAQLIENNLTHLHYVLIRIEPAPKSKVERRKLEPIFNGFINSESSWKSFLLDIQAHHQKGITPRN